MMVSARGLPLDGDVLDAGDGFAEIVGGEVGERLIEACGVRAGRSPARS